MPSIATPTSTDHPHLGTSITQKTNWLYAGNIGPRPCCSLRVTHTVHWLRAGDTGTRPCSEHIPIKTTPAVVHKHTDHKLQLHKTRPHNFIPMQHTPESTACGNNSRLRILHSAQPCTTLKLAAATGAPACCAFSTPPVSARTLLAYAIAGVNTACHGYDGFRTRIRQGTWPGGLIYLGGEVCRPALTWLRKS